MYYSCLASQNTVKKKIFQRIGFWISGFCWIKLPVFYTIPFFKNYYLFMIMSHKLFTIFFSLLLVLFDEFLWHISQTYFMVNQLNEYHTYYFDMPVSYQCIVTNAVILNQFMYFFLMLLISRPLCFIFTFCFTSSRYMLFYLALIYSNSINSFITIKQLLSDNKFTFLAIGNLITAHCFRHIA